MRPCARGCWVKGQHLAVCASNSPTQPLAAACEGCYPVEAADNSLICELCTRQLLSTLKAVPMLLMNMRSTFGPLRAQIYDGDKIQAAQPFPALPVPVDLLDAEAQILETLSWWANYFGDPTTYHYEKGFAPGIELAEVHKQARWVSDYLILNLHHIVNDKLVTMFSRKIIDWPEDADDWTVKKALARFPLEDRGAYAKKSCPSCNLKSVWVSPPRHPGDDTHHRCKKCGWTAPRYEQELWTQHFTEEKR